MSAVVLNKQYLLLSAVTIDGKIALDSMRGTDWTSKEDKKHLRDTLDDCEVILVGHNTYKTALQPLSRRLCVVLTNKELSNESLGNTRLNSTVKGLLLANEHCIYCNPNVINLREYFEQSPWQKICVLGGRKTYTLALELGLISEIVLTVEPLIFGRGLELFSTENETIHKKLANADISLSGMEQLNAKGALLLRYSVKLNS